MDYAAQEDVPKEGLVEVAQVLQRLGEDVLTEFLQEVDAVRIEVGSHGTAA